MVEQAAPKISHLLTPGSPLSARRGSSPLPVGPAHRPNRRKGQQNRRETTINYHLMT